VGRGGGHLLTASMDSIAFASPTRVGDIMYISAQVWSCRAVVHLWPGHSWGPSRAQKYVNQNRLARKFARI
jgi:hypothetical protein